MPTTKSSAAQVKVLVLGGGPDGEREVSINSSSRIASALKELGTYDVHLEIIDRLTLKELKALPGDVIVPYLHGPYGEGGPLQDLLDQDGRPYVGSGPRPSRSAMDKIASKFAAARAGVETLPAWILAGTSQEDGTLLADPHCPCPLPVIIKPVHEGSTLGLHVCLSHSDYTAAIEKINAERASGIHRTYMIEPKVGGQATARELTVAMVGDRILPVIEIKPKQGLYDYQAKYISDDTRYIVDPDLPSKTLKGLQRSTRRVARALGLRHIARADYLLDESGNVWFLEINTTPGMTSHSLVPMAAAYIGVKMPALCDMLVQMALGNTVAWPDGWTGQIEQAAPAPSSPAALLALSEHEEAPEPAAKPAKPGRTRKQDVVDEPPARLAPPAEAEAPARARPSSTRPGSSRPASSRPASSRPPARPRAGDNLRGDASARSRPRASSPRSSSSSSRPPRRK